MQIEAQDYLRLAENAERGLAFFDIESTGFNGDFNQTLCVSVKPFGEKPFTFFCDGPGDDRRCVKEAQKALSSYTTWCGYYSKGFDVPFLNARLLINRLPALERKHHIDLYFVLSYRGKISRNGLGHWLRTLDINEKKMDVSPTVWREIFTGGRKGKAHQEKMIARCESDTTTLEKLYNRTKHLILNISR